MQMISPLALKQSFGSQAEPPMHENKCDNLAGVELERPSFIRLLSHGSHSQRLPGIVTGSDIRVLVTS